MELNADTPPPPEITHPQSLQILLLCFRPQVYGGIFGVREATRDIFYDSSVPFSFLLTTEVK